MDIDKGIDIDMDKDVDWDIDTGHEHRQGYWHKMDTDIFQMKIVDTRNQASILG
jgi:hypothetical protein